MRLKRTRSVEGPDRRAGKTLLGAVVLALLRPEAREASQGWGPEGAGLFLAWLVLLHAPLPSASPAAWPHLGEALGPFEGSCSRKEAPALWAGFFHCARLNGQGRKGSGSAGGRALCPRPRPCCSLTLQHCTVRMFSLPPFPGGRN